MKLIPENLLNKIIAHAEAEYPQECCGLLLGRAGEENSGMELVSCKNVQDDFHQKNPEHYPRTAKEAFLIHPQEMIDILKKCRTERKEIRLIYHSHVDSEAYFSKEDEKFALSGKEPNYPHACYLILSVLEGRVKDFKLFEWNAGSGEFNQRSETK